ncbi:hypothetical protein CY35_11G118500 [Sphagnum magellanicum]|nr:hypothetical protein CY35_11G118500 [Sphagnum magellanicum]
MPKIWNTKPNTIAKYMRACEQIHGARSKLDRMREKLGRGMAANGKSARQKEKKKKDSKDLITADAGILSSQGSLVKRVKKWWPFRPSSSWESAAIATCTIFVFCAPVLLSGLSVPGFLSLFLISLFTWRAFEYQGFLIVVLYFLLAMTEKSGRRGLGSVLGSGAVGVLCAFAAITGLGGWEWEGLWKLGFLTSFCTKLSDTISSEIGKAYGKTTYLVTTMSTVPRGTEGAVSLEGTLAGLLASVILSAVACALNLTDQTGTVICVVTAQIANLCESFIGAALQGHEGYEWSPVGCQITDGVVNIVNIMIGATLAILMRRLNDKIWNSQER